MFALSSLRQAKERSIESLRDTLATTKRSYEGRIAQAESALTLQSAEVRARGPEGAQAEGIRAEASTERRYRLGLSLQSAELRSVGREWAMVVSHRRVGS